MMLGQDLLVTLRGDLDDRTVEAVEQEVTAQVAGSGAQSVLIDVSDLDVVDSFVARVLARLVAMVRILGAEAAVVGIGPAVAITLVELGVPLGHLTTALNPEQGMARLHRMRAAKREADDVRLIGDPR